jgi:hypothetical protein
MAASISAYSGGDNLVEMNLPRFSFIGKAGRPTGFDSFIYDFMLAQRQIQIWQSFPTALTLNPPFLLP